MGLFWRSGHLSQIETVQAEEAWRWIKFSHDAPGTNGVLANDFQRIPTYWTSVNPIRNSENSDW